MLFAEVEWTYGQPVGTNSTQGAGGVTSIATGCQATGGTITKTGTIQTQEISTDLTGAAAPIIAGYCGGLELLDNSSAQIPTIAEAGSAGFPVGWYTDLCNPNTGAQTITPGAGTIGGASTYVLAAGSAAAPNCVRIISDGVSNYQLVFAALKTDGTSIVTSSGVISTYPNPKSYYLTGNWYLPRSATAYLTAGPGATLNTIYCSFGGVTETVTIKTLGTLVQTGQASSHIQFAVYKQDATTADTLDLVDKTASVTSASSSTVESVAVGNTTDVLSPGILYAWCYNVDTSAVSILGNTGGDQGVIIGSATLGNVVGQLPIQGKLKASTFNTWPATISIASMSDLLSASFGAGPIIAFQVN